MRFAEKSSSRQLGNVSLPLPLSKGLPLLLPVKPRTATTATPYCLVITFNYLLPTTFKLLATTSDYNLRAMVGDVRSNW